MRDLAGGTVILTRAHEDNEDLAPLLRSEGMRVIEIPCVSAVPLEDPAPLADALRALGPLDWLVVTSRAGADAVARAATTRAQVAAVGDATAARLRRHGWRVDFMPSHATGAALGRELPAGPRALLARSDRALLDLPEILRSRGFDVNDVVAYRTVVGASGDLATARDALTGGGRVAIFFWSPSAIDGLLTALPRELIAGADVFVAGEATRAAAVERLGAGTRVAAINEEVMHVAHR